MHRAGLEQGVHLALRKPDRVEPYAARLPKASLGRGCIRFKRLDDIDLDVIDDVVAAAAAFDGQRFEPEG